MRTKILAIVQSFGSCNDSFLKEDLRRLEYSYSIKLTNIPSKDDLCLLLPEINQRDGWRLRMLSEADEPLFDFQRGVDLGEAYNTSEIQLYKDTEVRIVYSIEKTKKDSILSVYDYDAVVNYLTGLPASEFMGAIKSHLDDSLVLEVIGGGKENFSTRSIAVINENDSTPSLKRDQAWTGRIEQCGRYCQWSTKQPDVLPEDFFIINNGKEGLLSKAFMQVSLLLSACYVADYSGVEKNQLKLRISGFKTLISEFNKAKVCDLAFNEESVNQWYDIYDWCYTGGYTSDRLTIARNIISLNCTDYTSLQLNASTLESIKSNFRIFEQDNVRQYIKVRKDVSKDLLDLQDRINSVVEGFTGDFRKNVVGLGTFFLTLVVVRVVANGQWAGAFSNQILVLSFIFIVLSAVLLIYSRLTLEKKEKLYAKHYDQLRERYKLLLSEEEAKKIFEECNPKKVGTHADYIQWQKKTYTWIWGLTLGVFLLFIVFAWCYNLFETTNLYKVIKTIISCCTKSI